MEMEYGDEATRRLHVEGISYGKAFDKQALMRLNRIKAAVDQRDRCALRGNRFEKLTGDRARRAVGHALEWGRWRHTFVIVGGSCMRAKLVWKVAFLVLLRTWSVLRRHDRPVSIPERGCSARRPPVGGDARSSR